MSIKSAILKGLGFYATTTGGGCMAYQKDLSDDKYILITDIDGCRLPEKANEIIMMGFYDGDNEGIVIKTQLGMVLDNSIEVI